MKSYVTRLREKEWSMGNGQCPECCGLSPKWYKGGFLNDVKNPSKIGHEKFCLLARMMKDYGIRPVMLGNFME
jgi:hypothetical protein